MTSSVVIIGSLNMDLVVRVARAPGPGETLSGRAFRSTPGGKGANQAVAAARMAAKVTMVGRVGADAYGDTLRRALADDGVDVSHVGVDVTHPTGVALIVVEDSGENRIVLAPGANHALRPEHVDEAGALVDAAAVVVLQLEVPMPVVERAIQRALRARRPVLLNPAPAAAIPQHLWSRIDLVVPNETEAFELTGIPVDGPAGAAAAAARFRDWGARTVIITLGAQGVVISDSLGVRHRPARPAQVVDTTAAGDTFIGALAAGFAEGRDLDGAVDLGLRAASISVTRPGAQASMPHRREFNGRD